MSAEQKATQVPVAGVVDARGKACPQPNVMIKEKLGQLNAGDVLEVIGDASARRSVERFIRARGHETIGVTDENDTFKLLLRKAEKEKGDIPVSTCELK
jgi:TusA-related sulfurtransferase